MLSPTAGPAPRWGGAKQGTGSRPSVPTGHGGPAGCHQQWRGGDTHTFRSRTPNSELGGTVGSRHRVGVPPHARMTPTRAENRRARCARAAAPGPMAAASRCMTSPAAPRIGCSPRCRHCVPSRPPVSPQPPPPGVPHINVPPLHSQRCRAPPPPSPAITLCPPQQLLLLLPVVWGCFAAGFAAPPPPPKATGATLA